MVKRVEIVFINYEKDAIECSTYYRIKTESNDYALIEAIKLFVSQCMTNHRDYEIISATIDED